MRDLLPPPLRSVWTFLGYILFVGVPLGKLISLLGDVNFVMSYALPILDALNTWWGTLSLMGAGFGLLAWANHKQRTEAVSTVSADPESKPANVQHDRGPRRVKGRSAPEVYLPDENEKLQAEIERLNKEIERRDKKLQAIGHDYDQLRAELSDPTAKRQREEQMARERCLEVSDELFAFLQGRPFVDPAETVAAFKQRQQWKVDEVRDRMDDQGLLTQREREALTFRSDNQLDKIEAMVELLARLGQGG